MREGLDKLIAAPPDRHRIHFRDWLLSTVENKGAMIEGPLDHYLDIITGPIGQASLFQHQIAHYDPRHTDELTGRLHELGELSVRLIWGERDGWQRLEWTRRLHTAIPGSELCTVPDAGHFVMEDAPGTVGGTRDRVPGRTVVADNVSFHLSPFRSRRHMLGARSGATSPAARSFHGCRAFSGKLM
jgi:pimeloyl-ACP methyl ester carboxylesterase